MTRRFRHVASVESEIRADHTTGLVVWRMAPDVASFYADELRGIQGTDNGIRVDVDALLTAVSELEEDDAL